MTEADAVARVSDPVTAGDVAADLRTLGVRAGDTLLVHASLSALGWVAGGAQAVVEALQSAVTADGTLVLPTHTPQYTDPAGWSNPPVPDGWVSQIRAAMPTYRPAVTPSRGVGAVPECFRSLPGATRSAHPVYSVAAWGAGADGVVADHAFDRGLGESSPLASVYDRDGRVLLLGVGHGVNTTLHLAEHRASIPLPAATATAPVVRDGERTVVEFADPGTDTDDFTALGADYEAEAEAGVRTGSVGAAGATLLEHPSLVDYAVEWFEANRRDPRAGNDQN